jgi:hypothetical protein
MCILERESILEQKSLAPNDSEQKQAITNK